MVAGFILFPVVTATAQQYAIPWHRVAAGGAASSGGRYCIVATIGQPVAGALSSPGAEPASRRRPAAGESSGAVASYRITAGFTAIVLQGPATPSLVVLSQGGASYFSWSAALPGYVLQQCSRLDPSGVWEDVQAPVVTNGTLRAVQIPMPSGAPTMFFRLRGN